MRNETQERSYGAVGGGVGFTGLLTLIFITLKLTGVIGWSWLWVLSPLWILPVVFVVFMLIALIFMFVLAVVIGGDE